eukprot:UN30351
MKILKQAGRKHSKTLLTDFERQIERKISNMTRKEEDTLDWFHLEYRKLVETIEKSIYVCQQGNYTHQNTPSYYQPNNESYMSNSLNRSGLFNTPTIISNDVLNPIRIPNIIENLMKITEKFISDCRGNQLKQEFYVWWSGVLTRKCNDMNMENERYSRREQWESLQNI